MIFREGALAFQRGQHRDLQELGQLEQLVGGLGVHHSLARHDHRTLRRQEPARCACYRRRVGRNAHLCRRDVVEVLFADLVRREI